MCKISRVSTRKLRVRVLRCTIKVENHKAERRDDTADRIGVKDQCPGEKNGDI